MYESISCSLDRPRLGGAWVGFHVVPGECTWSFSPAYAGARPCEGDCWVWAGLERKKVVEVFNNICIVHHQTQQVGWLAWVINWPTRLNHPCACVLSPHCQILFDGSDVAGKPTELFYVAAPFLGKGCYSTPLVGKHRLFSGSMVVV